MDIDLVNEGSTIIMTVAFVDEDGEPTAPTSMNWSLLYDDDQPIVEEQSVGFVAATTSIAVSGTWLTLANAYDRGYRTFIVEAVYDSDAGSDLPVVGKKRFRISDVLGV